uniref:Signal peptidase complex catalytic subunit SEC11 n=1 Tax=Rhabditophanes sp. KR3021 TaxID=114890 RepID=A0AC35TIT7_9BILA
MLAQVYKCGLFDEIRRMNGRQVFFQVLNFLMIVSSALMIWKGLMVVTGSESPIVVVLSGSMEPAYFRGDLLTLYHQPKDMIQVGDVTVFKLKDREIPIVHRVIKVHGNNVNDLKFLTKGDNNQVDDRGLYPPGQTWLKQKDVTGQPHGFIPFVGMITIIMNDYPQLKFALLGVLGLFVLIHRE